MDIKSLLEPVITLASILAAIVAWITKLKWSKEYGTAKDEIIKAKEAQIELLKSQYVGVRDEIVKAKDAQIATLNMEISSLRELNPVKRKEFHDVITKDLEAYNDRLKKQLEEANIQIAALNQDTDLARQEMQKLEAEKESLKEISESMANTLGVFRSIEKAVQTMANTDPLTKLPNRRVLHEKMEELIQAGNEFSFAYLNIDYFKQVNDQYGHEVGDQLLINFAEVLRQEMRPADFVTRLGGDEFAVVLLDTGMKDAKTAMNRFREALLHKSELIRKYHVSVSIGIATSHSEDAPTILREADAAMYKAKIQGKNRIMAYEVEF